jgi:hypothetical protein
MRTEEEADTGEDSYDSIYHVTKGPVIGCQFHQDRRRVVLILNFSFVNLSCLEPSNVLPPCTTIMSLLEAQNVLKCLNALSREPRLQPA